MRFLIVGVVTSLCVLVGIPNPAHAATSFCHSDPTVTLSDGTQVVMAADIGSDISYVQNVTYTLHIPASKPKSPALTVTSIVYDQHGSLETVNVVADQPGRHYQIDTTVNDTRPQTLFQAYASVNGSQTEWAAGMAGKTPVSITFTHG